jgi:hypothetical protein
VEVEVEVVFWRTGGRGDEEDDDGTTTERRRARSSLVDAGVCYSSNINSNKLLAWIQYAGGGFVRRVGAKRQGSERATDGGLARPAAAATTVQRENQKNRGPY